MRLLKRLLLLLVVLIASAVGIALLLPAHTHGERSVLIDRPPSMVFPMVNGYRRFNDWSPWAELDSAAVYTRSGPDQGVGARLEWKGNNQMGEGSQEILRSVANEQVETALQFGPMQGARGGFVLAAEGEGTRLTWTFDAELPLTVDRNLVWNLVGRLMGPWLGESVGKDYERGLRNLKTLLEALPRVDLTGLEAEVGAVSARPTYFISTKAALDTASSNKALIEALAEIAAFATLNALKQEGPPRAVINGHSDADWSFDATIPFDRNDAPAGGHLRAGSTHEGTVALFKHVGSHAKLGTTHQRAHAWLAVHGWTEIGRRSEIYVTDPMNTPEAELLTILEVPVEPAPRPAP